MSFVSKTVGTKKPNFLESEVGLVLKTAEISQSLGKAEGNYVVAPAGILIEGKGILFEDVDVTSGDMPGSVLVAGRVLKARLDNTVAAGAAALGITVVDGPETTR